MKYLNFICYSLLLMLLFNTSSLYAAPPLEDHTLHTPLSLMPEPLSGSHDTLKLAATWWLPDWQGSQGSRGSNDIGGGDIVKDDSDCMKHYNLYATCPSPKLSTGVVHPVAGMTCQKGCVCPSEYKYTSSNCSGKYTLSGGSCDGKYNDCVCKSEYSQNSSNCNGEYRPAGESCDGNYNRCEMRPECTVSSMSCTYGCAGYNSCDRCTSCKSNPDCDVTDKSCDYGCASTNSCGKCTSCKDNPDCSATAVSCDYGCASTNSCGICTSCSGNPDCNVSDKSCDYGCSSTNSCGKCTSCKSCTPSANETGCTYGTESCSDGCGGTRLCCKGHTHSYSCPSGYSASNSWGSSAQTASKTCSCGAASGTCYKAPAHTHSYSCPSGYQETSCTVTKQVQTETTSKVCSSGDDAVSGTCFKCRTPIVGDIYYSDGSISDKDDISSGKTPVGIVAYIDGGNIFAISLTEVLKTWSSGYEDVSCLTDCVSLSDAKSDMNGKSHTQCLVNYNGRHNYPAAEYCNTFSPVSSGSGSNGWYLPAIGELYTISFNYNTINLSLKKLSKTQISSDFYWSSSKSDYSDGDNYAWRIRLSDSALGSTAKKNSRSIRCVIAL